MEKILNAAPEIRTAIQTQLNPDLTSLLQDLKEERAALENQLADMQQASQASIDALRREKQLLDVRIAELQSQISRAQMMLTMAAVRDVRWLKFVRTTLMPKQHGRVPFHNSAEVAMRGYHAASGRRVTPVLHEVTWSKLLYTENKLHRGYKAGIIFKGSSFVPGVTYTNRRVGEIGPPPGNSE
jgi:hypothetical protein